MQVKKQITINLVVIFSSLALMHTAFGPLPVYAQEDDSESTLLNSTECEENEVYVSIALENSSGSSPNCIPADQDDIKDNPIIVYLRAIVQFLAVGVGLVITVAIVIAGIQYSASRENPQAIQAATQRLTNAIIALITFIFMAAILNFLVPGGLV